jgi:hypothetical protein
MKLEALQRARALGKNLLCSFRQSLTLLLNLSSQAGTQMPKHRPSPRLDLHVRDACTQAGQMGAYLSEHVPNETNRLCCTRQ